MSSNQDVAQEAKSNSKKETGDQSISDTVFKDPSLLSTGPPNQFDVEIATQRTYSITAIVIGNHAINLMAKTVGPTQADILFNETAVLAARSRRILQSLLGPPTNGSTAKTEEELDEEDAEIFKPEPDELLGPGFPAPGDGGPLTGMQTVQTLQADERFRKQMLGKNAKRLPSGKRRDGFMVRSTKTNATVPMQPRPTPTNQRDESDEEEGRSSLGKTKRRKIGDLGSGDVREKEDQESEGPTISEVTTALQTPVPEKAKKMTGIYLDEILSEKSKKNAKKKKRFAQRAEAKLS